MSCHQNNNETRCQKTTTAKVQSRATAKATPMGPTKVDFDLELDVKPKCCRIKRRNAGCPDPCRPSSKCAFTVEVELDVDARISPFVQNNCFPIRLDVETHHQVQCDNSSEHPSYTDCHPHLRKNCRCGNPHHHRR